MDTINVSDLKSLISKAHATLCVVLHALDTKVLIGEISRPAAQVTKVKRKRRTKKEMESATPKMDLEKEYQADRHESLNLPDADIDSEFYGKPKKERKKREKKKPVSVRQPTEGP